VRGSRGRWTALADIVAEAARLRLDDRLHFLGRISDVREFWRERDVAVLLSDHEGSPNALIEAALLGRPLVATAVGGVPEMVDETVGALVDPDDPVAIAGMLQRLIEDAELRNRLGPRPESGRSSGTPWMRSWRAISPPSPRPCNWHERSGGLLSQDRTISVLGADRRRKPLQSRATALVLGWSPATRLVSGRNMFWLHTSQERRFVGHGGHGAGRYVAVVALIGNAPEAAC
jgi:hypothetical protein